MSKDRTYTSKQYIIYKKDKYNEKAINKNKSSKTKGF
jgi:hypothetical protein